MSDWTFRFLRRSVDNFDIEEIVYEQHFGEVYIILNITNFLEYEIHNATEREELIEAATKIYNKPLNETWTLEYGYDFCRGVEYDYDIQIRPHMDSTISFTRNPYHYCAIEDWHTSQVTDMSLLFHSNNPFYQMPPGVDLSDWNTSNVTTMQGMFKDVLHFNGDLSWNTASLVDASHMFSGALKFNRPLPWDTQNVEDTSRMFSGATVFNQNLEWDTGNVKNMEGMFGLNSHRFAGKIHFIGANSFQGNISGWNTESVTDMSYLFSGAEKFNGDLSAWNVSNVVIMKAMFGSDFLPTDAYDYDIEGDSDYICFNNNAYCGGAPKYEGGDLTRWDTQNVEDMSLMFYVPNGIISNSGNFDGNISTWSTGEVTNMSCMFYPQSNFKYAIGNWNTEKVQDMSYMFAATSFHKSLNWNTSSGHQHESHVCRFKL